MKFKSLRMLIVMSALVLAGALEAATYYVSSHCGDDARDGLSVETAWKSLQKLNSIAFESGDSILLASDSVFKGQFAPKGSGAMQNGKMVPIVIDRYGEGALPRIDGEGKVNAPLFLENVEGWEIQNLELTNQGDTRKSFRYGLYVENNALPTAHHFLIRNITVRNVNGGYEKDYHAGAGIRFRAIYDRGGSGPSRNFDRILIEKCLVKDCSRNGIVVHGGGLRNHWSPSTGVVIRQNLIEGVGGDGILPTSCLAPLVEWNIMRDCPAYGEEGGAAAGMWPWSCDDAVFQFNEVVGHKAWNDAQAYDCDYNCNNTLYQYNLSRDNEGGFMLICSPGLKQQGWLAGNAWNRGSVVRYNLSMNDGLRTVGHNNYKSPVFHITGETTQDTEIYSNLIIIPEKPDPKMDTNLFHFDKWQGRDYPLNTKVWNNIFVLLDGQPGAFDFGRVRQLRFQNNCFYGNVEKIEKTEEVKSSLDQFIKTIPKKVSLSGTRKELQQFALFLQKKGNPQEDAGITINWRVK